MKCRYKHAKQRDIENARDRGNSIHQSRKKPLSLTQAPVNTEEFLNQKEEDVAVEDQFFYKFFKERARRNVGRAKKGKKEDEDEEAEMDKFAEDMADEMLNQKVGSEDDDILDDFEHSAASFKKILPRDYDRILKAIAQFEERGMGHDEAEVEAFYAVTGGAH